MLNDTPPVWSPNNGRFDDGIEEKTMPVGSVVPKHGDYFRKLMTDHNVSESDILVKTCRACGKPHRNGLKTCPECHEKEEKIRLAKRARMREIFGE